MIVKRGSPSLSVIDTASFIFAETILGTLSGFVIGYWLDHSIGDRRMLALISAFVAVGVATASRSALGRFDPAFSLRRFGKKLTPYVWMSICLSTVVGGLAGHDLCELFQDTSGALIGLVSGALAAVSKAILAVLYFHEHPEAGVEFK